MRRKRELGDPRSVAGSRPTASAYFALGVFGRDREDIPAWAVVRVMRDLGMSESAARGTLLRLRQAGRIEATRSGRTVCYRLTEASIRVIDELTRRVAGEAPDWDGVFHGLLYSIPERHRDYRDSLRRFATLAGFGQLRPGLLISPWMARWRVDTIMRRAPAGSQILELEVQVPHDRARDVAAEAWDLPKLARDYRRNIATLDRRTERLRARPVTGRPALRALATTLESIFATVVVDPGLPERLLPEDWPARGLNPAIERFQREVRPPAIERLRELLPDIEIADPATPTAGSSGAPS